MILKQFPIPSFFSPLHFQVPFSHFCLSCCHSSLLLPQATLQFPTRISQTRFSHAPVCRHPLLSHTQDTALGIIFQNPCFNDATLSPLLKSFKQLLIIYQTQAPHSEETGGGSILTLTKHFTDFLSLDPPPHLAVVGGIIPTLQLRSQRPSEISDSFHVTQLVILDRQGL